MLFPYSPQEVREITSKTLMESNHANPRDTVEALIKARPAELQHILDEFYETDAFPTKLMELCSSTFVNVACDSAKIALWIYSSDRPDWPAVESNPKKAIREWLDALDKEDDGTETDASMTSVSFFKDSIRATIYTNHAEKVLKSSGKSGIFASAAVGEKELREPYELVKAPAKMTTPEMMEACSEMTQGLVRIRDAMFWRVKKEYTEVFRAKVGLASGGPRTKRYEVGPIPTRVLGGSLCSALAAWGWAGARAVCSRSAGQGMTSWLIAAAGSPPARTLVVGGSTVARIIDARPVSRGAKPASQPGACAVQPGPQVASAAPPAQRRQPATKMKMATEGTRTWAQVVAGEPVARRAPTAQQDKAQKKVGQMAEQLAKMEARLEKRTQERMAALERKLDNERAAREEQAAKIDAIFAYVQQSAGTSCQPAAPRAGAQGEGQAQKKRMPRRASEESEWTTVEQGGSARPRQERKKMKTAGKKTALYKHFEKKVHKCSGL